MHLPGSSKQRASRSGKGRMLLLQMEGPLEGVGRAMRRAVSCQTAQTQKALGVGPRTKHMIPARLEQAVRLCKTVDILYSCGCRQLYILLVLVFNLIVLIKAWSRSFPCRYGLQKGRVAGAALFMQSSSFEQLRQLSNVWVYKLLQIRSEPLTKHRADYRSQLPSRRAARLSSSVGTRRPCRG